MCIVSFDDRERAIQYLNDANVGFELLLDPTQDLYRKYKMEKASLWALINPLAILKYTWLIVTGTMPGKPGKDVKQLGGDVLIDPDGVIRYHFVSEGPLDRPSVDNLLNEIDQHSAQS